MESSLQLLFSLFLVAVCSMVLYLYYIAWSRPQKILNKLRQQGITGPPPSFLFGNSLEIKRLLMAEKSRGGRERREIEHGYTPTIFPFFEQWRKVYGPVFSYSLGNVVSLHISHPDLVREISLCSSLGLGKTSHMKKTHEPLFGQGILKTSGEVWSHQRKVIAPEFFSEKVKGMVDLMVDSATPLLKSWDEKVELQGGAAEMNVDDDLRCYSADVLSRTCFGSNYVSGKEIFLKIRQLQNAVSSPNLFAELFGLRYLPTKQAREAWRVSKEINSLILKTVKDGNASKEHCTSQQNLLQAILRSTNSGLLTCTNTSDSFVVDNCKNIYFAGHETTAITTSWCLMLLALHPEWQARARAEAKEICGSRSPDANSLQKMKILTMVIQETLRLYPPGAYVAREAREEMVFGGIHIPKGVNIFVRVSTLHHDPNIWGKDVLEFKPERFARGVVGACQVPHTYLPFGVGPRTCLGQHFAMMELKIILSLLLPKFSFSLSPKYCHSPVLRLIVEPEFGVELLVKKAQSEESP
ncbi:Cytochrome P450 [Canna indica]|uniref:Cytochrome P450 n=1 Tax=Canna indica TaxID=4628 RepID=A0AAQ3KX47_9LILI|nr:Cytochrome P450 [Canna indica]